MKAFSLASGSKGNAYLVEQDGVVLLIDCGLSCRELCRRMQGVGLSPSQIAAIFFTHSHADHIDGLRVFHAHHPQPELYANLMTAESIAALTGVDEGDFACFENGQEVSVGPFTITGFSIPHDTSDPVGYLVRAGGVSYFHGTDIGCPLDSVGRMLAEADFATLESNHDPVLLRQSGRPSQLISRIAGPRGHLSNAEACDLVRRFASPRLKCLSLAHLSRDCNEPHLAEGAMRAVLTGMERSDVGLRILSQDLPMALF